MDDSWIPFCAVELFMVQLMNSRVAIMYSEPAYNFMPCGGAVLFLPFIRVLKLLSRLTDFNSREYPRQFPELPTHDFAHAKAEKTIRF